MLNVEEYTQKCGPIGQDGQQQELVDFLKTPSLVGKTEVGTVQLEKASYFISGHTAIHLLVSGLSILFKGNESAEGDRIAGALKQ